MFQLPQTDLKTSRLIQGCMRLAGHDPFVIDEVLQTNLDLGMNFFDHADIYAKGESQKEFAKSMKRLGVSRDQYFLQSKAGICKGYYNSSKDYILTAVDGILKDLQTDYLDVFLIHRPDQLTTYSEVAETFNELYKEGKVRYFGVSNFSLQQLESLQHYMDHPLVINQLQFGPAHPGLVTQGIEVNMTLVKQTTNVDGLLDYMQREQITMQAWSPFQVNLQDGLFMNHPQYKGLTDVIRGIAFDHQTSFEAIVMAWILKHPANIQPIIGSMTPERIRHSAKGLEVNLSKEEWYRIYAASTGRLP
ncbi:aldo/keto reductase [Dolosicoccus paucivorans]|uniref:Aldo/keto reductase n=1 Tax=Dolosicoccus paucivorans TaxID=84521 RepID=A0A1G8LZ75_9LACT|nr:aldo/keto reductase [Dolosicoccus paucivorans]PMB83885.1 aldo/keto reductase [Dolosicoccus paucivorans]PMC58027.1 aldo/keto reductase [Dolosicoccus paucivorans]SDI61001.1 Predicted oxidoreductase [Dolosicoccus paucivorans]